MIYINEFCRLVLDYYMALKLVMIFSYKTSGHLAKPNSQEIYDKLLPIRWSHLSKVGINNLFISVIVT